MAASTADPGALRNAWLTAEREAMAALGFYPLRDEVYAAPLDGAGGRAAGDWEARVVLPKQSGSSRGAAIGQERPQAGIVHHPTERLIRTLKGYRPGGGPDDVTVGTAGRGDLPQADYPALAKLRVTAPGEIPAAVAETIRTVREVYLPLVRDWATTDSLLAQLDRPPLGPIARRYTLERRAVLHHLRGDNAAALAALAELSAIAGNSGIEAVDAHERAFLDGLRARVTTAG